MTDTATPGKRLFFLLLQTSAFLIMGWTAACTPIQPAMPEPPSTLVKASADRPAILPTATQFTTPTIQPTAALQQPTPIPPTALATAAPTKTPTRQLPRFSNPRIQPWADQAADAGAEFIWLNEAQTGIWQYETGSFFHPLALDMWHDTLFLIDAGRVLAFDLRQPAPPRTLLAPGDFIDQARVLEPLDLAVSDQLLLVLDRAGDVYQFDLTLRQWQIDRYDRPVRDTSGHYFMALAASSDQRYLLETNYNYILRYGTDTRRLWPLPPGRQVDISVDNGDIYVLSSEMASQTGILERYREGQRIADFQPAIPIERPRQLQVTNQALFVLDQAGRRLLAFDREQGHLWRWYQLPQEDPASTFWIDSMGQQLILAGRQRLYFAQQPQRLALIAAGEQLEATQPHDPAVLSRLPPLLMPIAGSDLTSRDLQLPGAPRHYRLGIHEGVDLYWQPGTPVRAVADGQVIYASPDFQPITPAQAGYWRTESQRLGYTSAEGLDFYRGMQVWIQHQGGLVSRYGHLSQIAASIVPGMQVDAGTIIGAVGNSGSPTSLESDTADAHLHFELRLGDHYVGQFLRPIEIREWLAETLSARR